MIQENQQKRIITNEDLMDSILGLKESLADLRVSTLDGFDRVFQVMDDWRAELKNDDLVLRKEMNQRFSIVDKKLIIIDDRLSNVEDNMVYKHQLSPKFA